MNNYDDILVKLFWNKETNQGSKYYRKFNQKQNSYSNIFNYLNNRFNDSESIYESLLRLVFNIFERPVCQICGNKVRFIGKPNNKGIFTKTCCQRCSTKLTNNYNKHIKESQEKAKKTKLEKYGDEHYNNSEQIKKTKLEKYGISGYNNLEKIKQTKLELYGDKNYNNREKYYQTCIYRYNIKNYVNSQKCKQTKLELYGDENYNNAKQIKLTYLLKTNEEKKQIIIKLKQTKLERYGDPNYNNSEKNKQTCLKKYGVKSWSLTNKGKKILSEKLLSISIRNKVNNTKRKNNTFNVSKPENKSYELLKEKYPDVKRQYRSELYPFNCDFYIPSLDLYIECQYGQFHHKRPYIGNEQDLKDVEILKEKANRIHKQNNVKLSRYDVELETWIIRDVKKRNIAKQNNLNFIEFWNLNEVKEWIINQH